MIHLDTHVVIWLAAGRHEDFPRAAENALRGARPKVSPIVRLELALLHEIGRIKWSPAEILDALRVDIDLGTAEAPFERVAAIAATLTWTRDPFDPLIVAHAMADDLPLITKDRHILANAPIARWDQ